MRVSALAQPRVPRKVVAQGVQIPAPVGGWDAISPLANMPVDRAVQLDNWIPRPGWIEPRNGSVVHSTGVGTSSTSVETLMAYNGAASPNKLFSVAGSTIYDCTTAGAASPTTVTNLTTARLQYKMFADDNGDQIIMAVNGSDNPVMYNGTAWSNPNILVGNATGSITFSANPSASSTITLDGTTVTFVSSSPTGNQVLIGASLSATMTNLLTFLQASADPNLIKFTYAVAGGILELTAASPGTAGNSLTIAASAATPSGATLTGGFDNLGITPATFVDVNSHQGRLWFVPENSTNAVYMATPGAFQGQTALFPLGPLMTMGGYLEAVGTWTIDTRQNVDEYIAFITSRGQVIVYAGTDPSTSSTWALVGVYQIGRPIGRRCYLRIAGDLQIICIDGVVGMSEMLSTDRAAANRVSLTSIIMSAMALAASSYFGNFGWQLIEYAKSTLAILNIPTQENSAQVQFVMNTITGAWCRFTGINANTWVVDASDKVYWGGNNGTVYQFDVGSGDAGGTAINCICQTAFNNFGNAAQLKRYTSLQSLITTPDNVAPSVGINVDFQSNGLISPPIPVQPSGGFWDQSNWDQFNWGSFPILNAWVSVAGLGHYVSIESKLSTVASTSNPSATADIQLNGWNIVAESGAFI